MTYGAVRELAATHYLDVFGGFHANPDDGLPDGVQTLLMLGPLEPGFWDHITAEPEFTDGAPDPIDRWSIRVIGALSRDLGGTPFLPFGGPPYHPFIAWAKRTGRAWSSEIGLLVHDTAGLMVSYRGAIGLSERLDLPAAGTRPCDSCDSKPCRTACPVSAFNDTGYDIPACKTYLVSKEGQACMEGGCLARRACPLSEGSGRLPRQSAHHMRYFLG